METSFADQPQTSSAGLGVPRGAMLRCKLTSPANPVLNGPVTFTVTAAYKAAGSVLVPKGATGICRPQNLPQGRVGLSCDTLNVPGHGAVAISAIGLGTDQEPGIPVGGGDDNGAGVGSRAKDRAIGLGTSLVGAAVDGVAGQVVSTAAETGADALRGSGGYSAGAQALPAPKGSPFSLFIQHAF